MRPCRADLPASIAIAAAVVVCLAWGDAIDGQGIVGLSLGARVLKRSTHERGTGWSNVLVGPQSAFEIAWRLLNTTGAPLAISSPDALIQIHVADKRGAAIPSAADWSSEMAMAPINKDEARDFPFGSVDLPDSSWLSFRGSIRRVDGSAWMPGDYLVDARVDVKEFQRLVGRDIRPNWLVDPTFPLRIQVVPLSTPARQREFHLIEAGFCERSDPERALEHYRALASMPAATWSDSLPLASALSRRGRYREAADVYRRILPDMTRGVKPPAPEILAGHLFSAALCFALEGDTVTAHALIQLEGRTPEKKFGEAVDQRRKMRAKTPGSFR